MVGVCQFVVFYARHTAIMKYSCSWSPCRTNITSKILPPRISDGSWGAIYSSEITVDQESNRFTLWKNDHILWSHSFFLKQWKLFAYFYQNWLSCNRCWKVSELCSPWPHVPCLADEISLIVSICSHWLNFSDQPTILS